MFYRDKNMSRQAQGDYPHPPDWWLESRYLQGQEIWKATGVCPLQEILLSFSLPRYTIKLAVYF